MIAGATPFIFKFPDGLGDRVPPFVPRPRVWWTPGNPYPDAFGLPSLPLPLLMRVSRLNRRMAFAHRLSIPAVQHKISGTTKDSTGAALGSCDVHLFRTTSDVLHATTTSGADGSFSFASDISPELTKYIVAYKQGSPDVAGTTANTLTGT